MLIPIAVILCLEASGRNILMRNYMVGGLCFKYLHDFFILEFKNDFYLDCEADRIHDLFRRFRMFKLRSDIEIEIVEQMTVTVFFGDYLYDQMPIGSSEGEAINWLDGVLFTDPRLNKIGTRAILPKNSLESSKIIAPFSS